MIVVIILSGFKKTVLPYVEIYENDFIYFPLIYYREELFAISVLV